MNFKDILESSLDFFQYKFMLCRNQRKRFLRDASEIILQDKRYQPTRRQLKLYRCIKAYFFSVERLVKNFFLFSLNRGGGCGGIFNIFLNIFSGKRSPQSFSFCTTCPATCSQWTWSSATSFCVWFTEEMCYHLTATSP